MKKNTTITNNNASMITRKQAIKKAGVTALTAATVLFLSTKKSSAASDSPGSPGSNWP